MEEKKLVSFLKQAAEVLKDFFPVSSSVLFPVIYASLLWALNRRTQVKDKILEIRIWLEPEALKNKPEEFILNFFESAPELRKTYAQELKEKNLRVLKPAFQALYPILGLEDPFLEKLFSAELERQDYGQIVADFKPRINKAVSEIEAASSKNNFWKTVENLTEEFLDLGWALLSESEVRKKLKEALEKTENENQEE